MTESMEEGEYLAVMHKMGVIKPKRRMTTVRIYEDLVKVLERNGIPITSAVNIGLEMYLRSKGLWKPLKVKKVKRD